jgi:hypothetical protein
LLKPNVSATAIYIGSAPVTCPTLVVNSDPRTDPWTIFECECPISILVPIVIATVGPCLWSEIRNVSISIPIPSETDEVSVYLWNGNDPPDDPKWRYSQGTSNSDGYYGDWAGWAGHFVIHTPLLRDSRVFGLLSWRKKCLGRTVDSSGDSSMMFRSRRNCWSSVRKCQSNRDRGRTEWRPVSRSANYLAHKTVSIYRPW